MEQNLTYLLGAGASCQSLPLGTEMFQRLRYFKAYLYELFKFPNNGLEQVVHAVYLPKFIDEIDEIVRESENYELIDHYARSLYNNHTKELELHRLKMVLSLFLIYEQSLNKQSAWIRDDAYEISQAQQKKRSLPDEITSRIKAQFDKRYPAWLQKLWGNNEQCLKKTNIITWNYDMQPELYYSKEHGCSLTLANEKLNVFPSLAFKDNQECSVVKLNGIGGVHYSDRFGFDEWMPSYDYSFEKILPLYLAYFNQNYQRVFGAYPTIADAWDNNQIAKKARSSAQKILGDTGIVVVIGYSFPQENYDVDKEIFSSANKVLRIIIQDKEPERVSERLKIVLPKYSKPEIVLKSDVSSFIIPVREIEEPRKYSPMVSML